MHFSQDLSKEKTKQKNRLNPSLPTSCHPPIDLLQQETFSAFLLENRKKEKEKKKAKCHEVPVPWPFAGHGIKVHSSSASGDCHRDEQRERQCTHITLGDTDRGGGGERGRSICQANSREVFRVNCTWHAGKGRDRGWNNSRLSHLLMTMKLQQAQRGSWSS